uniref:Uncharacterized protein n=1 Tax=Onchocerca volvulus TaxID=6282 RepID=A0A8R1XQY0_ONCVO
MNLPKNSNFLMSNFRSSRRNVKPSIASVASSICNDEAKRTRKHVDGVFQPAIETLTEKLKIIFIHLLANNWTILYKQKIRIRQ